MITVSVILLSIAAIAWGATYYLMPLMTGSSMSGAVSVAFIVSDLQLTTLVFFEFIWVVGMIAMMFPAMIPIVAFYNKLVTKLEPRPRVARAVGTPLFLLGYLATYAGLGLIAYLAVFVALKAASTFPGSASLGLVAPSIVLVLAGVYQLSPWKSRALAHCVSPLGFFAIHSRKGLLGSVRMGFRHGVYCVACCWAYMLVMLAVAVMSLPFMAILAAVIASEKALVRGAGWFNNAISAGFIALGMVALVVPNLFFAL